MTSRLTRLTEPAATAPGVELADYLELQALRSRDRNASVRDLMRDISRSGSVEVLDSRAESEDGLADPEAETGVVDPGGDAIESVGQAAISEIDSRIVACGGVYPFTLDPAGVLYRGRDAVRSSYVFMLLLTRFGGTVKKKADGAKLFEDLSAIAAAEYFGYTDDHALVYPFGFPRRLSAAGFERALNELCSELGEGQGTRKRPDLADQKDATLDLAVAKRFPDGRPGQLIGFGQCATGGNWRAKASDLRPDKFCQLWMLDAPAVTPLAMFFVPHAIEDKLWLHAATYGGVLFDRCRIAYYTTPLESSDERTAIKEWIEAAFEKWLIP